MRPVYSIDLDVVARNARAWAAFAGVPVRAVLKSDAYNWGMGRMAAALEDACEALCVADADEFFELRPLTSLPIVVLGSVAPTRLSAVLDAGGTPTIGTREELAIATDWSASNARPLCVRVGVLPAAGWSGLDLNALEAFAPALADKNVEVEVWTHVTDAAAARGQVVRLQEGVSLLRRHGVKVAASDAGATLSTADRSATGDSVRIGVGLFGATGGPSVPGVENALHLRAEVLRVQAYPAGTRIGYGEESLETEMRVATVRCGYGDGYPKDAAGADDILSVGMQYALLEAGALTPGVAVDLLGERIGLDALAKCAGRSVHEIVTTMGAVARNLEER
ncbi:MAG: alanine racemase [Candidatus Eremiobacteraeota bacterium]|nr:alanine racemase [Candidatus Eremiobacteraeota bacterium]